MDQVRIRWRRNLFALLTGALSVPLMILGFLQPASPRAEGDVLQVKKVDEREAHPLWRGSLSGAALDSRFRDFAAAIDRREDPIGLYAAFLDQIGVKRIIEYAEGRDRSCHGMLHPLGEVLVERTDLKTSMMLCGNSCTYACVHGAMKRHLVLVLSRNEEAPLKEDVTPLGDVAGEEKVKRRLRREVLSLCREDSKAVQDFFAGNCAHSVGHGFAALAKGLSEARGYCALFPDEERRYYCESGIFMELRPALERQIYRGQLSAAAKREIALRFCIQNSEFPSACLRFLLEPASAPEEIDDLGRKCSTLDGKIRRGCFQAVGYISRSYVADRPEEINRVCRSGDPTDRALCISGLAFVKKDHRLKEKLARSCNYLSDPSLKGICEDQHRRFYYQVDNPVMEWMFLNSTLPAKMDRAGPDERRSVPSRD